MCYVVLSEVRLETCGLDVFAVLGNCSTILANAFKQL